MGVEVYVRRSQSAAQSAQSLLSSSEREKEASQRALHESAAAQAPSQSAAQPAGSPLRAESAAAQAPPQRAAAGSARQLSEDAKKAHPPWLDLRERVRQCERCPELVKERSQTVFGVGDPDADWMFIGEAPGFEEDRRGEPFVGRAGQLLNKMLQAMTLRREQVYIANIIKCRPPDNRTPSPLEVGNCSGYLRAQIDMIAPKTIVALGAVAARALLARDSALKDLRGMELVYNDTKPIPLIVTYHPAYLLRFPKEKRKAWEDLQLAMKVFSRQPA